MGLTLEIAYMEELPFVFANYCTEDADRVAPILKVYRETADVSGTRKMEQRSAIV